MELEANENGLLLKVYKKELSSILLEIEKAKETILLGYNHLNELGVVSFKDTATE